MFDFILVLKTEICFFIQNRKKYYFQTITNYIERVIFLTGMILLVTKNNTITIQAIVKCIFWFVLVNSFLEISQRIELEIRLKQFDKCFNCNVSYWLILFIRFFPIFIESFFIALLSSLFVSYFANFIFDVPFINIVEYILMMLVQYNILLFIYAFIGIYFQRIQAIMGLIESYTFFYSGIVIVSSSYSLSIFKVLNRILDEGITVNPIYWLVAFIEIIVVIVGVKCITRYIKTK